MNEEYQRKTLAAADMADAAWLQGGLDEMEADLRLFYLNDADPVFLYELERLYHRQIKRVLPPQ